MRRGHSWKRVEMGVYWCWATWKGLSRGTARRVSLFYGLTTLATRAWIEAGK